VHLAVQGGPLHLDGHLGAVVQDGVVHLRAHAQGWESVGINYVPAAIEAAAAKSPGVDGFSYIVGDVTRLPSARLGTFGFFLGIGCLQGLDTGQRLSQGGGVSALANPGVILLLLLSFGPSRWQRWSEARPQEEVQTAFVGWGMLASEPADTAGLGWPMNKIAVARTAPD